MTAACLLEQETVVSHVYLKHLWQQLINVLLIVCKSCHKAWQVDEARCMQPGMAAPGQPCVYAHASPCVSCSRPGTRHTVEARVSGRPPWSGLLRPLPPQGGGHAAEGLGLPMLRDDAV